LLPPYLCSYSGQNLRARARARARRRTANFCRTLGEGKKKGRCVRKMKIRKEGRKEDERKVKEGRRVKEGQRAKEGRKM
jgi:hypothetical protein